MNNEELIKENIDLREKVFYLKMKCNCFTSISINKVIFVVFFFNFIN